ncbi:MAG: MCP four helix bundle domain-containing protein [Fulvivirga sp.]
MKWLYSIKEKLKIAMALAIVFLLVLITNTINTNHFTEIQKSFTSFYEDRLLVENYIFKLSRELNEKRIKFYSHKELNFKEKGSANHRIDSLIIEFQKTVLTQEEAMVLSQFVEGIDKLYLLEDELKLAEADIADNYMPQELKRQYNGLSELLLRLSDIQLEEGQRLMDDSNNIVAINYSYSRIEIIVLIVVGLIIQALIFTSRSMKPKLLQNEHLN